MTERPDLALDLVAAEAVQLHAIVSQFAELASAGIDASDPAIRRLLPDAYPEDPVATAEFRALTGNDLLGRRAADAAVVLRSLGVDPDAQVEPMAPHTLVLHRDEVDAWIRTLAAVRLVLAERLGIADGSDGDPEDPRVAISEWLGARLDGIVTAASADTD